MRFLESIKEKPFRHGINYTIFNGHALEVLKKFPDEKFHLCITQPPFWGYFDTPIKKQYWVGRRNWYGSLGQEPTPELFLSHIVEIFKEIKRVLRIDGTLWFSASDNYISGSRKPQGGLKQKDLVGMAWREALALQADGWYLRSEIILNKTNPKAEFVTDRPTRSHEYIFLLTKSKKYFYDHLAIMEKSSVDEKMNRNMRSVWTIKDSYYRMRNLSPDPEKPFEPCIRLGISSRKKCIVLDPFMGSGNLVMAAIRYGECDVVGIDLNRGSCELAANRFDLFNKSLRESPLRR